MLSLGPLAARPAARRRRRRRARRKTAMTTGSRRCENWSFVCFSAGSGRLIQGWRGWPSRRPVSLGNVNAKVKSTVVDNPGFVARRSHDIWRLELATSPRSSIFFSTDFLKIFTTSTDPSNSWRRRGERRRSSPRSRPNRACKRRERLGRNRNKSSASSSSDDFIHIKEVDLPVRIHKCLRVVGDVDVARFP
jgi:hypothetical protein